MNIKVWDINGIDFVSDIRKFRPCSRYYYYINEEILKHGDTLSDILKNKYIEDQDKTWLTLSLLGEICKNNINNRFVFVNAGSNFYNRKRGEIYEWKEVLPFIEDCMEKYEEMIHED